MNTVQLVLLWYGGLAITTVFVFLALDGPSSLFLIAAIATITGLAIATFATGTAGRRKWVVVWVVGPLVILAAGLFAYAQLGELRDRRERGLIATNEVEIEHVEFTPNMIGGLKVRGQIRNKSHFVLREVTLEFIAREATDVIDRGSTSIYVRVPPREVRDFADEYVPLKSSTVEKLSGADKRLKSVTWSYHTVGTRGEEK